MLFLFAIDTQFLNHEYFGEKVSGYLWFAGIVLATILLKRPFASIVTRISSVLTARFSYSEHKGTIRDLLLKPIERLLQVIFYFIALSQLDDLLDQFIIHHLIGSTKRVNISISQIIDHVFLLLFIIYLTQVVVKIIDFIYYLRMSVAVKDKNHSRIQLLPLIKEMSKLISWIISVFWILGGVFGVNIPALITGLGIGGVAIALAGKETVENFFAAFTILSDKPFQTGDTIKLGEIEAVVERIGFRSTRLRNLDGSAYIVPNQNLVSQSLINHSMRDNRGMKVLANIKYGITHEKLVEMTNKIMESLLAISPIIEPIVVTLESFDKETFQMLVNYHLPHPLPEDAKLIEIKRQVNLKVFELVNFYGTMGTAVGTS